METEVLEAKKIFKRIGFALFTMLFLISVMQSIIFLVFIIFFPAVLESPWNIVFLIGIPFYLVGFPVFLLLVRGISSSPKGEAKKLSLKQLVVLFFITMASLYLFGILGKLLSLLIDMIVGIKIVNDLDILIDPTNILPTLIFVGVLAPIVEEVIFRGVLLDKIRKYGKSTSIWFTAITFALIHGNFYQFFYTLIIGLIFGYIAYNTNSIRYTVIFHIIINVLGSTVMPALAISDDKRLVILSVMIVTAFIVIGSILLIANIKNINLKEGNGKFVPDKKIMYGNAGMIFFFVICIVLFASTVIT